MTRIPQGPQIPAIEQRDRLVEGALPFLLHQCRQPSLLASVLKPSGMRGAPPSSGTLHDQQGMPASPHSLAYSLCHGLSGWFSQTQPAFLQREWLL